MIDKPEIIQTQSEEAAIIHIVVARREMQKSFGAAVQELFAELAAQDVKPIGAVFAHHLKMSPETFDFELGVRVASPVQPAGRVKPGHLPAATVARTIYTGPYEGLFAAWGEFDQWIKANGHKKADTLWEVYSVGPHLTPNPAEFRTELNRPLWR